MKRTSILQIILTSIARPSRKRVFMAANDATEPEIMAVNDQSFGVETGGVMIVPFQEKEVNVSIGGRQMRGLQRIDAEAGNSMAADLGSLASKFKRLFVNPPIFSGHPFHPNAEVAKKYPDRKLRGSIVSIEVANETVRLIPKYNKLGKEEVEDGQLLFHSPQWRMEPVMAANGAQEIKGGLPVFRPVSLHSGGLTNDPNLEVPPVMGANDAAGGSIDISKLLAPFIAEGFIKADDDEAMMLGAINAFVQDIKYARERKAQMEADLLRLKAAQPDAANDASYEVLLEGLLKKVEVMAANEATAANEKADVEARFKAARTSRVSAAVADLIERGHVTNANAETLRTELIEAANEEAIDERLQELAKTKPRLGLGGGPTDALKGVKKMVMAANEQSEGNRLRTEAVHACLREITQGKAAQPGDQEKAWNLARSRNPTLFA